MFNISRCFVRGLADIGFASSRCPKWPGQSLRSRGGLQNAQLAVGMSSWENAKAWWAPVNEAAGVLLSNVLKSLHDWVCKVLRKIRRTYRCSSRQYQRSRTDYSQIVVGSYSLYKPTAIILCMELFRNLKEICLLVQHVWSSFASVKHTTKSTAA